MNTSIKALVAASASAMLIAAPAFAGGKSAVILEPEVAAEDDVIVPAAPSLPAGAGVAVAAGVGALAIAAAVSGDDDDDDDDGTTTTTPVGGDS